MNPGQAPFFVMVRRSRNVSRDAAADTAILLDAARSLGASDVGEFSTLITQSDMFVISSWDDQIKARDYIALIETRIPGLLTNADRTELRSDPAGDEPGAFHALIVAYRDQPERLS